MKMSTNQYTMKYVVLCKSRNICLNAKWYTPLGVNDGPKFKIKLK